MTSKIDEEAQGFTNAAFLEWLHNKPVNSTFDYCSRTDCVMARFLKETGICDDPHVGGYGWHESGESGAPYHEFTNDVENAALARPSTYGAVYLKLLELMGENA